MVRGYVDLYLAGGIECAALYITIIEALVQMNDESWGRLLEIARASS